VPYVSAAKELKTKPTQHSVKELRSIGIQPDILICRTEHKIPVSEKHKIALFCNVKPQAVIEALDTDVIYGVPVNYHHEGLDTEILRSFGLPCDEQPDMKKWEKIVEIVRNTKSSVTVAIVGKYISLSDAYKSINESLAHGGIANNVEVKIKWINSRKFLEGQAEEEMKDVNAILVPGGFGEEGSEGKIAAAKYARENKVPYFGI
jgi:CTP synthase